MEEESTCMDFSLFFFIDRVRQNEFPYVACGVMIKY